MEENDDSIKTFWNNFLKINSNIEMKGPPVSFYFCDNEKDANECAELVERGIKQATATSLWWYEKNSEPLPKVGDKYIVTDWKGNPKALIETTKIEPTPYNRITLKFAETEGEGDKSLQYWKRVHQEYYTREMKPYNEKFNENMIIICEYFKTIYTE